MRFISLKLLLLFWVYIIFGYMACPTGRYAAQVSHTRAKLFSETQGLYSPFISSQEDRASLTNPTKCGLSSSKGKVTNPPTPNTQNMPPPSPWLRD